MAVPPRWMLAIMLGVALCSLFRKDPVRQRTDELGEVLVRYSNPGGDLMDLSTGARLIIDEKPGTVRGAGIEQGDLADRTPARSAPKHSEPGLGLRPFTSKPGRGHAWT